MVKMSDSGLSTGQDADDVQYEQEEIPSVVLGILSEGKKICYLKEKQTIPPLIVVLETRLMF